jgi:Tfp pilus assembly protein PilO
VSTRGLHQRPAWQIHSIGIVCLLLIGVLFYVVQFRPLIEQRQRHADLHSEIAAHQDRVRQLAADLGKTQVQIETARRAVNDAQLALQPRSKLNDRLAAISELAASCGLQLETIEPGVESIGPRLTAIPVRLSARGTPRQAIRFLEVLRQRMPDNPTVAVEMTASPSAGDTDPVGQCAFDLLWYTSGSGPLASN